MRKVLPLLSLFFISSLFVNGQGVLIPNQTANQLVNTLVGDGVSFSNATLVCGNNASGKFTNTISTPLQMDSGIVLTSGSAIGVLQSPFNFSSVNNINNISDPDLQAIATGPIFNLCKLEFDFVPVGDTIQFKYIFGSEEYPGFTCSSFNDIFSFFINGPGYPTPTNVALIPGTNCPVSINTVNSSTANPCGNVGSPCAPPNNALFINNSFGTSIVYDGMTKKLTAKATVIPCSTYHMKFAIADVFDGIYDSGVFLEANSFKSDAVYISLITSTNSLLSQTPFAIEGCNPATVTLKRQFPKPYPQTVTLVLGGTASNGVDFTTIPSTVTIPANDTIVSFQVNALEDLIQEGTELLKIYVYGSTCNAIITDSATIAIQEFPTYVVSDSTYICQGQSVTLSAVSNPVNNNLNFTWTGGPSPVSSPTINVTPSTNTTYTLTASYPGCLSKDSLVAVMVDPIPTLQLTTNPLSCINTNGTILASATGNSPFTYTLMPGNISQNGNTATFSGLSAGPYTVTVSSGIANCTASQSTILNSISGLTWTNISTNIPTCNGATNGGLSVSVSGGNGVYSYLLQPGAINSTNGVFSNLGSNTYTITAQDGTGCTVSTTLLLNEPNPIIINSTFSDSTSCFSYSDGQIQVSASGGTGGLNYSLLPSGTNNTNGIFNSLNANIYTVVITDANGCSKTSTVEVKQPSLLQWTNLTVNDVQCHGYGNGSISMGAQGGTGAPTYWIQPLNLNNGSGNFTNINQGSYAAVVVDANGCTISTSVTINEPSLLQITNVNTTGTSCVPGNDGSITFSALGGTPNYSYSINNGLGQSTGNFIGLSQNTYTIQVSDANNCSKTSVVSISSPSPIFISSLQTSNVLCNGQNTGSINIQAANGVGTITYHLMPGSTTNTSGVFTGLGSGNYTITATDQQGCTSLSVVPISQPPAIVFTTTITDSTSCSNSTDGSITVIATGGSGSITYTLMPGNQMNVTGQFTALAPANYTITAIDVNGCSATTVLTVHAPNTLIWGTITTNSITCHSQSNGSIQVSVTGGTGSVTYLFQPVSVSNLSGFLNGLTAGSYTVTATDANNCFITTSLSLSQPPPLTILSISTTNESCSPGNDGTATVLAGGGVSNYVYNVGSVVQSSNVFIGLGNGSYTVTVTDGNACTKTSVFQIASAPPLVWNATTAIPVTCKGLQNGSLIANLSNGANPVTYTLMPNNISNTNGNFSGLYAGLYTINAVDALNCTTSTTVNVTEPASLQILSSTLTDPSCFGLSNGGASFQASGGVGSLQYQLQPIGLTNSNGSFNNLGNGQYSVIVTDANGCSVSSSFSLIQPSPINLLNVNVINTSCNPNNVGVISLSANGGTPPLQYSNNGLPFTSSSSFSGLTAGNYTIVVKDAKNCTISTTVSVQEPSPPTFTYLNVLDNKCHNDSIGQIQIVATGQNSILNYRLSPGGINSSLGYFINLKGGSYTILATDSKGCTASTSVNITNPPALLLTEFVPTNANCADKYSANLITQAAGGTGLLKYTLLPTVATNLSGDFYNLAPGNYTVTVSDQNNCSISSFTTLTQEICCDKIFVPNAFTPNGDGKNDEFKLVNAFGIKLLEFSIINRWGNLVFKSGSEEVGWNGKQKGEDCDVGTYYYLIKYKCLHTGQEYFLKGDITLIR